MAKQLKEVDPVIVKRSAFLRACGNAGRELALLPQHGVQGGYTMFDSARSEDVTFSNLDEFGEDHQRSSLDTFDEWEFAIDDDQISDVFATFPSRYFDPELDENVTAWRFRSVTGGPLEVRPEFQWNLEYNFFSSVAAKKMSADLTQAANAVGWMTAAFSAGAATYRVGARDCVVLAGWLRKLVAGGEFAQPPWAVEAWCREVAFRIDMLVSRPGTVLTVYGP